MLTWMHTNIPWHITVCFPTQTTLPITLRHMYDHDTVYYNNTSLYNQLCKHTYMHTHSCIQFLEKVGQLKYDKRQWICVITVTPTYIFINSAATSKELKMHKTVAGDVDSFDKYPIILSHWMFKFADNYMRW